MSVTDSFNRADAATLGVNWTVLTGVDFAIASNTPRIGGPGGAYNWSIYTGVSWQSDQSSQAVLQADHGDVGLLVNAGDAAGGGDGYMAMAHPTFGMRIYRRDNGSFTLLNDIGGSVSPGDVIKLARSGNILTYYKNDVSQGTADDVTYLGGHPGISAAGVENQKSWDDWVGTGELSHLTLGSRLRPHPFAPGRAR